MEFVVSATLDAMTGMRRAWLALVLIATTGCSWIFVEGPPARPRPPEADCTDSKTAPVVDTVVSVVYGAAGVMGLLLMTAPEGEDGGFVKALGAVFAIGGFGVALPFYFSARHGYQRVGECRTVNYWLRRGYAPR